MNRLEKKLLFKFNQEMPESKVLGFFVVGSHLFNLNGLKSDKDYFGLYMPSNKRLKNNDWPKQLNLGTNQTNQKNNKDDIDCKFFSLDEFLRLLANSDFNMLELLYAPKDKILVSSPEYEELSLRRTMFTPFDLSSFVGFVKGEARLHLVDQSSFEKYSKLLAFLKTLPPSEKMTRHFDKLENWNKIEKVGYCTLSLICNDSKRVPAFKVSTREFQSTSRVHKWIDECEYVVSKFGSRQKEQAKEGAAYKSLYHALRLLFEAEDLIHYGELRLPFDKERHDLLKNVKNGQVSKEVLFPMVLEHFHYVEEKDQDRKMNQMHRLSAKHDEFRHWVDQYFLNKKMQMLHSCHKRNHLMQCVLNLYTNGRNFFLKKWYNL